MLFYSIDNFNAGVYVASHEPIIFSQVNIESFDYGHGMKPMTTTTIEAKEGFKDNESSSALKGTLLTQPINVKFSLMPNFACILKFAAFYMILIEIESFKIYRIFEVYFNVFIRKLIRGQIVTLGIHFKNS